MTDKERQKLISELRMADFMSPLAAKKLCGVAADEIERLSEELQYQYACDKAQQQEIKRLPARNKELSRSGPADYVPLGGAGNGA